MCSLLMDDLGLSCRRQQSFFRDETKSSSEEGSGGLLGPAYSVVMQRHCVLLYPSRNEGSCGLL